MAVKRVFVFRDGEVVEVTPRPLFGASKSAAVHQDTLKTPLRHMVTGEITDSKSRLKYLNKLTGCECVGNDLLSKEKHSPKGVLSDSQTDDLVLDGYDRAEAVMNDPSRWRHRQEENARAREVYEKLIHGR